MRVVVVPGVEVEEHEIPVEVHKGHTDEVPLAKGQLDRDEQDVRKRLKAREVFVDVPWGGEGPIELVLQPAGYLGGGHHEDCVALLEAELRGECEGLEDGSVLGHQQLEGKQGNADCETLKVVGPVVCI